MSVDFAVRGRRVEQHDPGGLQDIYGAEIGYTERGQVQVAGVDRSASVPVTLDGDETDIVEIEDADGIVSFHRAGRLAERARETARGVNGTIDITPYLESTTRGQGGRLGVIRRFGVTLPPEVAEDRDTLATALQEAGPDLEFLDRGAGMIAGLLPKQLFTPAARAAALRLAAWIDEPAPDSAPEPERRRKAKERGVYRVGSNLLLEPVDRLVTPLRGDDGRPYLLLLHGTFSHTEGAFKQLRDSNEWAEIERRYPARILALEHATLSLSPVRNAIMAATMVPEGARLHLASHSRGGLVGDALCYAAHQDPDLRHYPADHPDLAAWAELRETVRRRGITVERFARVACPARGTTLISDRLDKVATVLFNVFKLVPVLRETGIAAVVQKFLSVFLDQRTDPRVVPGLEAQIPGAPLLLTLMSALPGADNGLGNIAGDIQGSGVGRRLVTWVADRFYREANDLVVPTSSMDGGLARITSRQAAFRGKTVDHGHYFANQDSRESVLRWLSGAARVEIKGFEVDLPPQRIRRGGSKPPAGEIILVPDAFGSTLENDGQTGWPDVEQMLRQGARESVSGHGAGRARALVDEYAPLTGTLGESFTVSGWPYDPRRSLAETAADLRTEIRDRLSAGPAPHLVAHGAGALVTLAALALEPGPDGLEERWRAAGGRAVLLGPPLDGSWLIAARLAGRDELSTSVALLDGAATPADVGAWFSGWRLLDSLLPDGAGPAIRRDIMPRSWSGISAVFGSAAATVSGRDDGQFVADTGGDGFSAGTGRLRGPRSWHAPLAHADLVADDDIATAVVDLLGERAPTRLLTTAPTAPTDGTPIPDLRGKLLIPTTRGLVRAAWGAGRRPDGPASTLRVRVVHGDLKTLRGTTIVGHQEATPIGGAERAADDYLDGALDRRLAWGQYPGRLGTSEVFLKGDRGVVVVGLGDAGDLNPKELTAGITSAVIKLAAEKVDGTVRGQPIGPLSVYSVLLGATQIPPMPVENSVTAVVQGVRQANRRLRDHGSPILVEELGIVELFEERAISAVRAAVRLVDPTQDDHDDRLVVERRLIDGNQGRPGLPSPDYYDSDIWRTIRIVAAGDAAAPDTADELSALSFTSVGRSARAEQQVNRGQRKLIDAVVAEAVRNHAPDPQILNTLYELLVPNSLKFQGYGSENLMLLVDRKSGAIPLEMLATRTDDQQVQPLAVEVGVVRRLETPSYTELSRRASGHAALVIGDPSGTGLTRLSGARDEALAVSEVLDRLGYQVTSVIPAADDPEPHVVQILNELYRHDYRVVHISGHGHYDADPTRSGVVIGPDTFLGALEIAQMRATPDLVFLNCCHLGALGDGDQGDPPAPGGAPFRPNRLASSISQQLIEKGVQAVVAAGWAVDDDAAREFAGEFYVRLDDGADLGRASLKARQLIHRRFGRRTNTWGAYQVWGQPAWRLSTAAAKRSDAAPPVARRELRDRLRGLLNQASEATSDTRIADVAGSVEQLVAQVPQEWLAGAGRILVGDIWAQLADYRKAEQSYEQVRTDWSAEGSLKALEQLANVRAKWAVQTVKKDDDRRAALDTMKRALDAADLLLRVGRTPERLAIRASTLRRLALCIPPAAPELVTQALAQAARDYREAAEMYVDRTDDPGYRYPAINAELLDWLVHERDSHLVFDADRADRVVAAVGTATRDESPDFWSRVADADVGFARALIGGSFDADRAVIEDAYRTAFVRSSRRERVTVLEHLDLVGGMLPDAPTRTHLVEMRARLDGWTPDD